ncbi:unnamed protein product [Microthlaspi erraticum]|uniref:Uncharacterized protein n=1 Tax=Microthlaspi erraticum TaxID=1685480 RepID=A0A6D2JDV2_9BRAS|nr:unnamed protein product [Microthlaspi erraticum]
MNILYIDGVVCIDGVVSAVLSLFQNVTGKRPRYKVDGGSNVENLGLQNIQARMRMVLAFMLASLLPWVHSKPGFYLVLGSTSNVHEGLRGYLTKFLYNSKWPYQFKKIDEIVDGLNGDSVAFPEEEASSSKEVGVVAANSSDPSAGR